jgi:hypothetical protein
MLAPATGLSFLPQLLSVDAELSETGLHTFLSKLKGSECDITDKTRGLVEDYIKVINQANKKDLIYDLAGYTCFDADDKKELYSRAS